MSKAYTNVVISARANEVWKVIREFQALSQWHPGVASSQSVGEVAPNELGSVRHVELTTGTRSFDELTSFSDDAMSMTYTHQITPYPVKAFEATLRVRATSDASRSLVEWYVLFVAAHDDEEHFLIELFKRVYFQPGLEALQKQFSEQDKI